MRDDRAKLLREARQAALEAGDGAIAVTELNVSRLQLPLNRQAPASAANSNIAALLDGAERRLVRLHVRRERLRARMP